MNPGYIIKNFYCFGRLGGSFSRMSHSLRGSDATTAKACKQAFDLIVIGAGSGGLALAKRAAGYGASVAIVEGDRYGGTCVNVGCVPKKIMFNAAQVMETLHEAKQFGIHVEGAVELDWSKLTKARDRYVQRLNAIHEGSLDKLGVVRIPGFAAFVDERTLQVNAVPYTAERICIASGGEPVPPSFPGGEHVIDSNGFFSLQTQPKKAAIIGAGYIAVELAGVLHHLGTATALFCRGERPLRTFDPLLSEAVFTSYTSAGLEMVNNSVVQKVERVEGPQGAVQFNLHLEDGRTFNGFDVVLSAIGRRPRLPANLPSFVQLQPGGYVQVDEGQQTSCPSIFALGDVIGQVELTPMAVAAGRRLADRLYGGMPEAFADYSFPPSVVFAHPPLATIGLTEPQAVDKFGDRVQIYRGDFVNMYYATFFAGEARDSSGESKQVSQIKLVCVQEKEAGGSVRERVVGLHIAGRGADEILQGFAVAIKMGATKADFDRALAIHPTAAEEVVTLAPWGLSGVKK